MIYKQTKICSLSTVPASLLSNSWNFLHVGNDEGAFCWVHEVTLGSTLDGP